VVAPKHYGGKISGNNALERLNHKILVELTPALTGFSGTAGSALRVAPEHCSLAPCYPQSGGKDPAVQARERGSKKAAVGSPRLVSDSLLPVSYVPHLKFDVYISFE
jgi:hypothetical protein